MKKKLEETQTLHNLTLAFLHESHAKMRYEFYAREAEKEGYIQIRDIFNETARNEAEHAKRFYKFLRNSEIKSITENPMELPTILGSTAENLQSAIDGEEDEATFLYPLFSVIAEKEGFDEIAYVFQEIGEVEEAHQARFQKLLNNIKNGTVFKKDHEVVWKCGNCGYLHTGKEAPEECPACAHGIEYFEVFVETY